MDKKVPDLPKEYVEKLVKFRRHFHTYPEKSFEEFETAKYIAEFLKQIEGLEIKTGIAKTGIVATLSTGKPGPCILLRADMDALPLTETTKHNFRSKNEGVSQIKHAKIFIFA
jgi:metal-dependent amidase/aminoacylase/carboxypeptidase family protein